VSHYFESHCGGIEIVAGQLARSLAANGMAVTWAGTVASPAPDDLPTANISASNLIERRSGLPFPIMTPRGLRQLFRAVREHDAVLAHDGMYLTSIIAIIAARLNRKPALLVQHIGRVPADAMLLGLLFWIADRILTRLMMRLASQVVFISRTSADHFADMRLRRAPLLIFNGVETRIFEPCRTTRQRDEIRRQLGWSEKAVMLFVGRFIEKKGILRMRQMAEARPDLHWAFVGWGPCDPDGWNLPNVSVFRNRKATELASLYRAADLLLLPSRSEGFPLVVQEALACGLHPICCDDAARADSAATSFVTGISKEGDEAEIIRRYLDAIDARLAIPETSEDRSVRASFARERYSWSAAARQYRAVLASLCAPAREQTVSREAMT
jgi:glycosyltransferase involved in cell wall biosynthesis